MKTMDGKNLVQQVENENEIELEQDVEGVPVCSANFVSPVIDTANYIGELHYKIGTRLYIENAD
jgi:hypothetical protein